MEFNILQILLVGVWGFIVGIDQFNLLESLYQPIVSGTVVGLILGDMTTGLMVGGAFQIISIGNMPVGGAQPPNPVIGSIMAVTFAISAKLDAETAIALAIPFSLLGTTFVNILFTAMAVFMSKADQLADKADLAGITRLNYTAMSVLGLAFAIVCMLGVWGGSELGTSIDAFRTNEIVATVMNGLGVAGGMMKFVGFAILLRIMLSADLWGMFLAGFVGALVLSTAGLGSSALLLLSFVGIAIALFDFNMNVKIRNAAGSANVGGQEDGI